MSSMQVQHDRLKSASKRELPPKNSEQLFSDCGSKSPDKKKSRTDEGIVEDDHAREDIHIRGLHNPSNSCYMNVVLQLLFLLEPISRNIMELAKASEQQDICSIIANALENLSSGLYDPYNPAGYHDAFAQFGFEKTVQEDAHEFLLMLLQKVGELGQDGVIGATLGFNVMKSFRCSNCGGEWKIEEPHRFLTLPITNSLKECIALYIRDGEILTKEMAEDAAEEATRECSDCLKSGFVMKGAGCFSKDLPPYLLFHLNRFERTQDRGIIKDNRPVSFQTDLDIKPYSEQPLNYKLRAVICHTSPSMDSGHYIIYVQPSGSQKWYLINDSTVREVNVAAVLTDQAYLLLYEKVEIDHKIGAGDGDGDEDEVKKGEEEMVVVVVEEEIEEALPVYWFPDEVSSSPELSTTGESRPESHHLRSTQPSTQPHKGIRAQSPAFPQSSSLSTVVREPTSGKWESWEEEKLIELLKKSVHIHKATWKENNFVFHWNYADIADSAELKMDPSGEPRGGRTAQQIYEKVYKRAYPAGKTAKKGSFESRVFEIIESEKKLFMNELHGARGWGVHHPVRDLAIMQESYRQHALIIEKKSYFDQGSEIDVIYSEEEKKTLENVYSTVSEDVKRSLDIDGILTKMIEILSDKRNSSLRAEIHPAHLIIKDCLRPGCNSLNLHGYSDWGLGLGYKARNGNATSADEEEVIRTILSKEDPDVLKETRVWGAGDKMKLIQKVMSCIIKNPAHRRLIRYRRMYKEEDLRGLIDSVITSAVGQRPTMERTSTGKKDSAVRSGSRKQPTQRKITSCEELDNAMRTASKDKTVSRSAGSGHLSSSKPTPHGSDSGTNQSHGKGNTERKSASKVRFADDDTSRERTNALTDDEFAISSSIAPNGDDNTWDDGFEGYFPDWNTDSGDHQSQTPRAVLLQPAVLRAQLPHNPSLDSIKKRLNDVETQPANRNTLATLVLNGEIHLRLDSELQNIADDLKASKWQPGESKPTFPLYLPTSAEAVLHGNVESLQLPFDGKGFAIFIIIGQLFYKRPSGGKLSYEAICIVPGYLREPGGLGVQLFRPDNGTALRLAMNKMYEAGFHRSTLELGEVPHVVVKQFLLYTNIIFQRAQRTSTGAIQISSVSKHEWSTLWGQSLGITYNNQKIKPINSKVYPVRLNTPSSKLLGKDAQAYESMGINKRVAGQFLSKSGRRREVDKVIDLHDEPLIDNAFHSEGTLFIREKRLVESISCLGAKRISPETLIETLKAAKAEFHLNDEQLDAVIALLFCDPSWSLQELSPRPVTLTYVTMDIDQVVGTGQIDADGFREYLSQIGITISPETNLEDGAIKNFIAHFMKILVEEVIMPSEYGDEDQRRKAFCNFIKTRRVSFSEKSVNDGYPKWASSVTGGSRRPVTDCFHVPSILKGTYIFHVAVRFIGESPPRDEVKKNIYAYASRISRYINREADHKWLEGSRYTSATEQQQGKDFTISSPGDCLLSYLTVLLFAAMAPRGRAVEFSLETFHNKEYAARIKLDANELSKQGYAEECAMRLKEESLCTPAHHIIRFLDTAKDILKPWKTVCRHGLGTCVGGHITESGANAVIQCDVIKLNDCMNIKSKTISELFAYKPEEKKEKTSAGDESDGSYESDEEESLDSESSDDEREGVQHLRPEAQPEAPPRPEAPPEAPSHTTQKSNVMPGFKTGFLFSAARQFLHMFHSFCGMLPLLLCANAYPRGNFEAFFKVPITLLATVIRFQLYLPVIRQAPGENGRTKATSLAMNTAAATGKKLGSDEEFLNTEKLRDDMKQLIENGMVFVQKIRQEKELPSRVEVAVACPLDGTPDGVFTAELFYSQYDNSVADAIALLAGGHYSGYPAETVGDIVETFIRGLNGLADAAIRLIQLGKLKEFNVVVKALRGMINAMFGGRCLYGNQNLFAPRVSIFMGRPWFFALLFIPWMNKILLEHAGGNENHGRHILDTVLQILDCLVMSLLGRESLVRNMDRIVCPAIAQRVEDRLKTVTRVCVRCMSFFAYSREKEAKDRFDVHPCPLGTERNFFEHVVELTHEAYVTYREAKIARRTSCQKKFIQEVVNEKQHVIAVGAAGCGKTEAAVDAIEAIVEKYGVDAVFAVSLSKKVAEKLGGTTLNRAFHLGIFDWEKVYKYIHVRGSDRVKMVEKFCEKYFPVGDPQREAIIRAIYYMLDESWQKSLDILEFVNLVCQHLRECPLPFGGMIRVFLGDPTQGRPFVGDNLTRQFMHATKRKFPDHSNALDYFFQSETIAHSGYKWFVFDSNDNKRMDPELAEFARAIRLSEGEDKHLAFFQRLKDKVPTDAVRYYLNLVAVVNYVAHIRTDFIHRSEEDKRGAILHFLKHPVSYTELHNTWGKTRLSEKYEPKLNFYKSMKERCMTESFNKAKEFLQTHGFESLRNIPETRVYIIGTENSQLEAMEFIRKELNRGKTALLSSKVQDDVFLVDQEGKESRHPNEQSVLRHSTVIKQLKADSAGVLVDDLNVYENQPMILTNNGAGFYMSSGDLVLPAATKTEEGKTVIEVKVVTDEGSFMPIRNVAKTVCVEVVISGEELKEVGCAGKLVVIRRNQYPLVPAEYMTSIRSVGLTLNGPVIADFTRTIKEGDGQKMMTRARKQEDLYVTHAPETTQEMNDHFFKCHIAPKTLINHLHTKGTQVVDGTFYVNSRGDRIVEPPPPVGTTRSLKKRQF